MSELSADSIYKRLFKASLGKILVLRPHSFEIVTVTDTYLQATMTHENDIIGKTLFEVFPDDPEDPLAEGTRRLLASLQRVQLLKKADNVGILRYPIRLPDGNFEERHWSSVNSPILNDVGEIEFIIHRVEDVTTLVKRGGKEFDAICRLHPPKGGQLSVRAIGESDLDERGSVIAVQGAFQDISTLQEAQVRFELISRASNVVIWDWDFATDKVWWNNSITGVFGFELSELEPGTDSWTNRIHPDDVEDVVDNIHEVIQGDGEYWYSEYRFIKSDGQYANVVDRGFIIRDENSKATRMVGSMLDITERMEMEQQLRESQKQEAVGHLTGGVAHDFNNLLTIIIGNAEMLAEVLDDPDQLSIVEMTLSAAQRGAVLTSRLLAFARRQPLDSKATDVNQLVEAMRALIRPILLENIELELVRDLNLGITEIDAGELDTALLNLVVNARDAMPNGGKLTIKTSNIVLDSHYAAANPDVMPGEYVMICVSDTGIGMAAETVLRAFEPFFTTKSVGKGSGLGLSMVFGFTKQSGGHLNIDSEPGEGTSVTLYFPRVRGAQLTNYETKAKLQPEGGTEHILIAEDDDLVLQHIEGQLRSLGYRVTAATSGPEALKALNAHHDIDLLLTDIIMPGGMNGRELADQARLCNPSLKVLYTSGYTENVIMHHGCLDSGVELLRKPYTRLALATKVHSVLGTDH
ncbi:PAS domain-containing protein [Nitrincola sp. MINF-07-Sa-05]|uniref:PAS domain-containing protein n=1 Tax=Nitrincola salilacus TaxID=3400273 RepID=UPI003917C8A6